MASKGNDERMALGMMVPLPTSLPLSITDNPQRTKEAAPMWRLSAVRASLIVCPPRSIPSSCNTAARRGRIAPANATPSKLPCWAAAIWVAPLENPRTKVLGTLVPQ
ncbi:hypothetical protein G6F59_018020 [Rhizopus arrhizus]|nr:hypothetical protein G6F59_018020 [Rhizopus arrhizus]